jgi:hypothetical protein
MRIVAQQIFYGSVVELFSLILAYIFKDRPRQAIVIFAIGTIVAGVLAFSPSISIGSPLSTSPVTIYGQTSDGELANISCSSWNSCRKASQNTIVWDTYSEGTVEASKHPSEYLVKRIFLFFDTSSIPTNAKIESATLRVYSSGYQQNNTDFHVVRSLAIAPLTYSDFDNISLTSGGSSSVGNLVWVKIELNASALSWINKNGVTALTLIHIKDFENSAPTIANSMALALSEDKQHRPNLVITYSLP